MPNKETGIMCEFKERLTQIRENYLEARTNGDTEKLATIIDFDLRALFQEQCTYLEYLEQDARSIKEMIPTYQITDQDISQIYSNKERLDSLVFNEERWGEFSNKLFRGEIGLPQLPN